MIHWGKLWILAILCTLLISCQTQPSNSPITAITPTIIQPSPTMRASSTSISAQTPNATLPPPAPPTSLPTATPLMLESSPSATSPAPLPKNNPATTTPFPDNVNPLTGLAISADQLNRRPVAIKISNYPPVVRPQWGLNKADLLFEHYAEGGVTRFTAVYYSQDAEQVGSVRSGRLIDIEIPQMYDAAFAYSGASGPVREMFRDSNFFGRIISPDFGHGGFERIPDGDKAFEHTLFTNTYTLRFLLNQRSENQRPTYPTYMSFDDQLPTGGTAASQIELRYRSTNAFWSYQPATGRYFRWTDGQPHLDSADSSQLNFQNIIVISANHVDTDILEDFVNGGNYSIQIQIWGEGPLSLFRDGQRFEGRWLREQPGHMLTFYDPDGNPLPLSPGNSFVQLVPLGFDGLIVTP